MATLLTDPTEHLEQLLFRATRAKELRIIPGSISSIIIIVLETLVANS